MHRKFKNAKANNWQVRLRPNKEKYCNKSFPYLVLVRFNPFVYALYNVYCISGGFIVDQVHHYLRPTSLLLNCDCHLLNQRTPPANRSHLFRANCRIHGLKKGHVDTNPDCQQNVPYKRLCNDVRCFCVSMKTTCETWVCFDTCDIQRFSFVMK